VIHFEDIHVGERYSSCSRTLFDADIVNFAGLSGDFNQLHVDDVFAANTVHGRRIAHGMLVASVVSGLRSRIDDFALVGWLETSRRFVAPTFPGDTITVTYEVVEKRPSESRPTMGVVVLAVQVVKHSGDVVQTGRDSLMVERRGEQQ
jgi:acyl dehydratase